MPRGIYKRHKKTSALVSAEIDLNKRAPRDERIDELTEDIENLGLKVKSRDLEIAQLKDELLSLYRMRFSVR